MKRCARCGGEYEDSTDVCPEDGQRLGEPSTVTGLRSLPSVEVAPAYTREAKALDGVVAEGTTLGAYQVIELLGRGGMGEVYLAHHKLLGRKVALKLLRSKYASNRVAVKRFFKEAQAACKIHHPNIVAITDFVENEGGSCFYVMEHLVGETLAARIARGPLELPELMRIGVEIADALEALHGAGVVHRDLKPANIFLEKQREGPARVKLLDFGLVKLVEPKVAVPDSAGPETDPDSIIGTPEYMSPEQIRGLTDAEPRTDLYSLGAILYEMATGQRPLQSATQGDLLVKVVTVVPVRPSERGARDLPRPLESLIMGCLEKEAKDRPETAAVVLQALKAIAAGEREIGYRSARMEAMPPAVGRRRLVIAAVAGVLLLGLVLAAYGLLGTDRGAARPSGPGKGREGVPIASLKEMWHQVHHRESKGRSWKEATRGMGLFHLDALRTAAGARAQVAFKVGGRLDMDELSEVLIVVPPDGGDAEPQARVARGTVRATAKPGRTLRIVGPDGKVIEVRSTGKEPVQVRARVDGERVELAALKGAARLGYGGRSVELEQGYLVDLKRGRFGPQAKLPAFPELLAPAVDARLSSPEATLRWREVPGARAYRVQVSNFINFEELLVNKRVAATELQVSPLGPDHYVWRVSTTDGEGHEGEFGFARRFLVQVETPAQDPLHPADNAVVAVGRAPEPVTFRWRGEGDRFLLVVARHASLRRGVVLRRRLQQRSFVVNEMSPGVYYWGVYSQDRAGHEQPLFDKPRRLTVRQLRPPKLQLPAIDWK